MSERDKLQGHCKWHHLRDTHLRFHTSEYRLNRHALHSSTMDSYRVFAFFLSLPPGWMMNDLNMHERRSIVSIEMEFIVRRFFLFSIEKAGNGLLLFVFINAKPYWFKMGLMQKKLHPSTIRSFLVKSFWSNIQWHSHHKIGDAPSWTCVNCV